ncbi:MAG: hypothetical protein ACRDKT_14930 [Actinomycetota bacterium]
MRSSVARVLSAACVAVLVLVVSAVPSGAHPFAARTQAKIHDGGPDGANGNVTSRNDSCVANRTVRLFRVQDGPDQLFGRDRTSMRGLWDIEAPLVAGEYYVIVMRRHIETRAHDHDCLRARSLRVRL